MIYYDVIIYDRNMFIFDDKRGTIMKKKSKIITNTDNAAQGRGTYFAYLKAIQ